MLKPLDNVRATVDLISKVAVLPEDQVIRRLVEEVNEIGANVFQELKTHGIPPYQMSDQLTAFYENTNAFLFETTVWNTCKAKQRMRDFILSRIRQFRNRPLTVFCCGDGLGFDSTALSLEGHHVQYYEPSIKCQTFADAVFEQNEVTVQRLQNYEEIADASLDAVICLDVLEHVPNPSTLVDKFHKWLKPDGLLFVHAPFWCLHWTRSTHLEENRHLSGELKSLYGVHGFEAVDASVFWDPILLQKTDSPRPLRAAAAAQARLKLGQALLSIGRWNSDVHTAIARKIARAPRKWREELLTLAAK